MDKLDNCNGKDTRVELTCDQESWLKDRVRTAIKMSIDCNRNNNVGSDRLTFSYALDGICDATVVEICNILDKQPCYVNIKKIKV